MSTRLLAFAFAKIPGLCTTIDNKGQGKAGLFPLYNILTVKYNNRRLIYLFGDQYAFSINHSLFTWRI